MDPAKSADLVLLHLDDEVQLIISELQVSRDDVPHLKGSADSDSRIPSRSIDD